MRDYDIYDIELADALGGGCATHKLPDCLCDVDLSKHGGCPEGFEPDGDYGFSETSSTIEWAERRLRESERRWFANKFIHPEFLDSFSLYFTSHGEYDEDFVPESAGFEAGFRSPRKMMAIVGELQEAAASVKRPKMRNEVVGNGAGGKVPYRNLRDAVMDYVMDAIKRLDLSSTVAFKLADEITDQPLNRSTLHGWLHRARHEAGLKAHLTVNAFKTCKVEECDDLAKSLGMCQRHYLHEYKARRKVA